MHLSISTERLMKLRGGIIAFQLEQCYEIDVLNTIYPTK